MEEIKGWINIFLDILYPMIVICALLLAMTIIGGSTIWVIAKIIDWFLSLT